MPNYLVAKNKRTQQYLINVKKLIQFSNRQYLIMITKIKKFIKDNKYKILAGVSIVAASYFFVEYFKDESQVKLSSFLQALKLNHIEEVVIQGRTLFFKSNVSDWYWAYLGQFPTQQLYFNLKESGITFSTKQQPMTYQIFRLALISSFSYISFKLMLKQIKQSDIKNLDTDPKIYSKGEKFDDFYGGELIKNKFREIIDYLESPQKYIAMGARLRKGVIFHGPPGTGKTMMARALANEAGVQFIKVVASEFQQIFVGVGPKRVREVFQSARKCKNGCIIFIDEIDALGSRDSIVRDCHETTLTINQILNEMDGFNKSERIVVIGATNRIDLVDSAVLRSGRFDLKIKIDLPLEKEREGILNKILQKKVTNFDVDTQAVKYIAKSSPGWSGADIQTLVNESVYVAIRHRHEKLQTSDLLTAFIEIYGKNPNANGQEKLSERK